MADPPAPPPAPNQQADLTPADPDVPTPNQPAPVVHVLNQPTPAGPVPNQPAPTASQIIHQQV